jgi:hypothetical protein
VKTGADGEEQSADVMQINRPNDLGFIADLAGIALFGATGRVRRRQHIVAFRLGRHLMKPPYSSIGMEAVGHRHVDNLVVHAHGNT